MNASQVNGIDPNLLISVMSVEGGRRGTESLNTNGSKDLGIMQINTYAWLPLVSRVFFNGDSEKAYKTLRDDGCFNIAVGAWILNSAIKKEGGRIWDGVGRYHSNTPKYKYRYIERVKKKYLSIDKVSVSRNYIKSNRTTYINRDYSTK